MYKTRQKFIYTTLIPFILGCISILGFAPFHLTLINFLSFPILLFILLNIQKNNLEIKNYFFVGCSFGFGFFLCGNYWIVISLTHDEIFKSLIIISLILIPLFLSVFFGFAVLFSSFFIQRNISFVLLFSLIFSIFEFLRGNILTGFPWNLIGYTWSWSLETIQILSIIGAYSLSLISITFFCLPFILLDKFNRKKNILFSLFCLILFICNYFYGLNSINKPKYDYKDDFFVEIISPNISLSNLLENNQELNSLTKLIKISNPKKNRKTIFIWPEGIFSETNLQEIKKYKLLFEKNFNENHLIALGINSYENNIYNTMVILNHKLDVLFKYKKNNLVPFGEFLPFESFFKKMGLKKITRGYNSFSSGSDRPLIILDKNFHYLKILPLICYEIIYIGNIKSKNHLPDLVINISEDGWFGNSTGPYQHFKKAIYRSIEEGVFIARSANNGISALINPKGQVLESVKLNDTGKIIHNIPIYSQETIFSKFGNIIYFFIILLYIFTIFLLKKTKKLK